MVAHPEERLHVLRGTGGFLVIGKRDRPHRGNERADRDQRGEALGPGQDHYRRRVKSGVPWYSDRCSSIRPAPVTTVSRGWSVRWTGTSHSRAMRMSVPLSRLPPPVSHIPVSRTSWESSGGASESVSLAPSTMIRTISERASRISSSLTSSRLGIPVATSLPRTSAATDFGDG